MDDLNKHLTALETCGFALNQKVLEGETDDGAFTPMITEATSAIDKYINAAKHIKKFLPVTCLDMKFFPHLI